MKIETVPFVDDYDRLHALETPHCVSSHSCSSVVPAARLSLAHTSRSFSFVFINLVSTANSSLTCGKGTLGVATIHAFLSMTSTDTCPSQAHPP